MNPCGLAITSRQYKLFVHVCSDTLPMYTFCAQEVTSQQVHLCVITKASQERDVVGFLG